MHNPADHSALRRLPLRAAAIVLSSFLAVACQEAPPDGAEEGTEQATTSEGAQEGTEQATTGDGAEGAEEEGADEATTSDGADLMQDTQPEGVVTLPSGLQYEVLAEGSGATPGATDTVVVHYHGTLVDGTVFDSSVERGEPASFPVNGVIGGWTEALQLMQEGDKWLLTIPPELAYGERGAGEQIGPNATLIFEVELIEVR